MLRRHYNSREIINPGELLVDGLLNELMMTGENWNAVFGLLLSTNKANKTLRGECDFVLVCEHGVLVLEVKGGLISYHENKILQKDVDGANQRVIDPFEQVRGNCGCIKDTIERKVSHSIFVGEAVVFPGSSFDYKGDAFSHFWHLDSKEALGAFLLKTLKKQSALLGFEKLSSKQVTRVVAALLPEVNWQARPHQLLHAKQEIIKSSDRNYKILHGLRGNKRLLVEGPPGSGKSSYARQVCVEKVQTENCEILYLCWNELLACDTNHYFQQNGVADRVSAFALFDYANYLLSRYPPPARQLTYADVPELYNQLETIINDLQCANILPRFDLVIIDEAQDLFDKGIDIILQKQMRETQDGLAQGNYMIFYDTLQAFDPGANSVLYQLIYGTLKEKAAFYKLAEHFRTTAGSGIANFLDDAMSGSIDLGKNYGGDMVIKTYANAEDGLLKIKQAHKNLVLVEQVETKNIVVLFSSNLASANEYQPQNKMWDGILAADTNFERLCRDNLHLDWNAIRYSTSLKYKGLESDAVILVINDLFNDKIKTYYQMYIGASRARAKIVLLIDEESASKARKMFVDMTQHTLDDLLAHA